MLVIILSSMVLCHQTARITLGLSLGFQEREHHDNYDIILKCFHASLSSTEAPVPWTLL